MDEITLRFFEGPNMIIGGPDAIRFYGWWRYALESESTEVSGRHVARNEVYDVIGVPLCYEGGCK